MEDLSFLPDQPKKKNVFDSSTDLARKAASGEDVSNASYQSITSFKYVGDVGGPVTARIPVDDELDPRLIAQDGLLRPGDTISYKGMVLQYTGPKTVNPRGASKNTIGDAAMKVVAGAGASPVQAKTDLSFLPDQKPDLSFLPDQPKEERTTWKDVPKNALAEAKGIGVGLPIAVGVGAKKVFFAPSELIRTGRQIASGVDFDDTQLGMDVRALMGAEKGLVGQYKEELTHPIKSFKERPITTSADALQLVAPAFAAAKLGKFLHANPKYMRSWEGIMKAADESLYDRFAPIRKLEGHEIAPEARKAGGGVTASYAGARTLQGKVKGLTDTLISEFMDIAKPIKDYTERHILDTIYSLKNYADLDLMGKTTHGVTKEAATVGLKELAKQVGKEKFERLSGVAEKVADWKNSRLLDVLVDGKLITREMADELAQRYPHYLRSEIVDEALGNVFPELRGVSGEPIGRVNKSFLKGKKGTPLPINEDLFNVTYREIAAKVAAAEKQKVVDSIAFEFGKEIGERTFDFGAQRMVSKFNPKEMPEGWVKSTLKSSDGKIYAVDKDVERVLTGFNKEEADIITGAISKYNNIFRGAATTYRLPFVITNIQRDIQTAMFNKRWIPGQGSQIGAYARGLVESVKDAIGMKSEMFDKFRSGGGLYGGIITSELKAKRIPFRLRSPASQAVSVATKPFRLPFELVGKMAEVSENTSRLAEFLRLQNAQIPDVLKVLNARDITVDFNKFGNGLRVWNKLVPFLNANFQGNMNTARAFRDQPDRSLLRAGAFIAMPSLLLHGWNSQFENDKYVDPYIKQNFWYINTGVSIKRNNRDVPVLGIVRKGEFAKQLSYPVEWLLEYSNNDPKLKERAQDFTMKSIGNQLISSVTPPLLRVIFEQGSNYDFYRQREIVPEGQMDVKPGQRFRAGTTNTARKLGEVTGIDPIRFEHALQGLLPVAKMVLEASDLALRPKPTIERDKKDVLQKTEAFQPIIRAPSGYFSPEEAEARRYLKEEREKTKTPKFLFREAYKKYISDRTPANLAKVRELAKDVKGSDRVEVQAAVNREHRTTLMPEKVGAARRILPKKYQKSFYMRWSKGEGEK